MKQVSYKRMRKNSRFGRLISVLFWLSLWQIAAAIIDRQVILPSPLSVIQCLGTYATTSYYWECVAFSMGHIILGFILGTILGFALAWAATGILEPVISLPMQIIRAVPVASFIILALFWVSSRHLSFLISFMMVLPIIYTGVLSGIKATPREMLDMAKLFDMPFYKKLAHIYFPAMKPGLTSAVSNAAGLAWKSGIAAEVIGITRNSIGNQLYQAKIYLEAPPLFAWTITIIVLSLVFEGIINLMVKRDKKND